MMVEIRSANMGSRPQFFKDGASDELTAMLLALTAELSVVYDRLDTVERLLIDANVIPADAVETFRPDEGVIAARKARHQDYLRRVFRIMRTQLEPGAEMVPFDQMHGYAEVMREVSGEASR